MKEIGGYLQAEQYFSDEYHKESIALNTARNCLRYLIKNNNIKRLLMPKYLCSCLTDVCKQENVEISFYNITKKLEPQIEDYNQNSYVYIINYFGQLYDEYLQNLKYRFTNLIVDNVQSFFQRPIAGIDTIYTCRKYFGVSDGAYLYTNSKPIIGGILKDYSYDRLRFLAGRFEKSGNKFFDEFHKNENILETENIKFMSDMTHNILRSIDYEFVKNRRTKNYNYLFDKLEKINKLCLKRIEGAFAYPLYIENGNELRKKLIANKIYVPTLWPNVIKDELKGTLEYDMALNILPLPCDQRYDEKDMEYIVETIYKLL